MSHQKKLNYYLQKGNLSFLVFASMLNSLMLDNKNVAYRISTGVLPEKKKTKTFDPNLTMTN